MNGRVDTLGRALVPVEIRGTPNSTPYPLQAWIDTGFNGELVVPQSQTDHLQLKQSGTVKAILADGSEVALKTYSCLIEWLDGPRELEVVANDGEFSLLGVGLLAGFDLEISYRSGQIRIR